MVAVGVIFFSYHIILYPLNIPDFGVALVNLFVQGRCELKCQVFGRDAQEGYQHFIHVQFYIAPVPETGFGEYSRPYIYLHVTTLHFVGLYKN